MPGSGVEAGASYGDLLVTSMLVLGAVCIAAFMAVRFFGRFAGAGRTRGAHLLEVVARVPLEPRRSLYVVEVAGKTLLVGTSEMGLSVLSELDAAEVKTRAVPPQSFADLVRGAWRKRKGLADVPAETRGDRRSADVSAETRDRAHVGGDAHSKDVPAETRDRAHAGADAGSKHVPAETRDRHAGADAGSKHVPEESRAHVGGDADSKGVSAETPDVKPGAVRTDARA